MKQIYWNCCIIVGLEGELVFFIFIVKLEEFKCLMKDIWILDYGNWRYLYWNVIELVYNSILFFEYYKDDFCLFYEKKYEFLMDFNEELC